MDSYHSRIIKIRGIRFLPGYIRKYLVKETKTVIQHGIVEADVLLEWIRLGIIDQTNHRINGLQSKLFFLSMRLDGIRNVDCF